MSWCDTNLAYICFNYWIDIQIATWSEWSKPSECEAGCLFGENGRLRDGSIGLKTFRRSCHDNRFAFIISLLYFSVRLMLSLSTIFPDGHAKNALA